MPVDSITWKKEKFYKAQHARKTIESIFSGNINKEDKK